jgi:hypothetical protein
VALQRTESSTDVVNAADTPCADVLAKVRCIGVQRDLTQCHPLSAAGNQERDVRLLHRTRGDRGVADYKLVATEGEGRVIP